MIDNEIRRLAHAINEIRPDWPVSSLTTFIARHLARRTYRDAAIALAYIATDTALDGTPASSTPARVLEAGPWWQAVAAGDAQGRATPGPPKPEQECPDHAGRWAGACGLCAHEGVTAYYDPAQAEPMSIDEARKIARANARGRTTSEETQDA